MSTDNLNPNADEQPEPQPHSEFSDAPETREADAPAVDLGSPLSPEHTEPTAEAVTEPAAPAHETPVDQGAPVEEAASPSAAPVTTGTDHQNGQTYMAAAPTYDQQSSSPAGYGAAPEPKGLALASLITGIASFLFGWLPLIGFPTGVAAIITGVLAMKRKQPKGLWLTGLILGAIGTLASIFWAVLGAVLVANDPTLMSEF